MPKKKLFDVTGTFGDNVFKKGVCKTRIGYLRMADADRKMRIEKCGWKKMRMAKKKLINK